MASGGEGPAALARGAARPVMMAQLSQWVGSLPLSLMMRRIVWLAPVLQTLHILATGIMLASIAMIDLRLFGVSRVQTSAERGRHFLPWLWIAFAIAIVTGIALMLTSPRSFRDTAF